MAVKSKLGALRRQAHAMGAAGTYVADVAMFGTRRTPKRNAGDAIDRTPAGGSFGSNSVWEGPKKILGGAPVLRRNQND